jgi:ribosomal protein S18 acetylase RimI-like enzyme
LQAKHKLEEVNTMTIRTAKIEDFAIIHKYDKHINEDELKSIINQDRVFVAEENGQFIGWLRYNLFWDNTPFMNMLYILDEYRGIGVGKQLTLHWEKLMKDLKFELVMTSTMSNEHAQHFYRKLNYIDAGSLLLPNEPLEIFFIKSI